MADEHNGSKNKNSEDGVHPNKVIYKVMCHLWKKQLPKL
jgi:hypothetical protein